MDSAKKEKMVREFDAFVALIVDRYEVVSEALEREDFMTAFNMLATMAQTHSRTALSLRNALIKDGVLEDR